MWIDFKRPKRHRSGNGNANNNDNTNGRDKEAKRQIRNSATQSPMGGQIPATDPEPGHADTRLNNIEDTLKQALFREIS